MNQRILMTALAAAVLSACGGGGGDSATVSPVTPSALTLSGTAATGAAIVGGLVSVKCAGGTTGSATTLADGSYTVAITGASLPCVLRVTSGTTELYSLADSGGGAAVRANITPFTQLISAHIAGGNPANLFGTFDASAQARLSATAVAGASSAVTGALGGTVELNGANPLTASFRIGDAFDQQLDAFKAALNRAGLTLADVTDALVASGGTAAPVQTLLRPVSTSCTGLRSGKYRVINPHEVGHAAAYVAHLITVDAPGLTVTDDLDATHTPKALTPDASTACQFTLPGDNGTATLLVAPSGLSIVRAPSSTGQTMVSIVLPAQVIALSELAGTWNHLVYARDTSAAPFAAASGTTVFDAAGQLTVGGIDCTGLDTCTPNTPPAQTLVVDPAGGFDHGSTRRAFAFKTANGRLSLFQINTVNGSIVVATKQVAFDLPALGSVSNFWDFTIGSNGVASTVTVTSLTVTAVDTAAQSFTRARAADGRVDSLTTNKPRNGLRYRAAATSPVNGGGTVSLSEILNLPLPGTGVSFSTSVAANQSFLNISVGKQ